jgi:hypothetical protein
MTAEKRYYLLTEKFIGGLSFDFPEDRAINLLSAKKVLSAISDIEDLYSLFISGFIEFEKILLESGIDYLFGQQANRDLEEFFENLHDRINLCILTLLTAYKSYDDQVTQRASDIETLCQGITKVERNIRAETYDSSLEYRVCCKLRDYAQHSKLPLLGISFGGESQFQDKNSKPNGASRNRTTINPYFSAQTFSNSTAFKAVRHEIAALNVNKIDTKQILRGFVAAMSIRHKRFQELLPEVISTCSEAYDGAYAYFESRKGMRPKFLHLELVNGLARERVYMKSDFPAQVVAKQSRPTALRFANRCFVSSEAVLTAHSFQGSDHDIWISE